MFTLAEIETAVVESADTNNTTAVANGIKLFLADVNTRCAYSAALKKATHYQNRVNNIITRIASKCTCMIKNPILPYLLSSNMKNIVSCAICNNILVCSRTTSIILRKLEYYKSKLQLHSPCNRCGLCFIQRTGNNLKDPANMKLLTKTQAEEAEFRANLVNTFLTLS